MRLSQAPSAQTERRCREAANPKNLAVVQDALYDVTGRRLELELVLGDEAAPTEAADEEPITEEALISMFKDTFDAHEVEDPT